jgi:hypothetical protein
VNQASTVILTCTDLYGNAGGDYVESIEDQYGINGNISEDPLFCDPDCGDLHLHSDSPCAWANNPECGYIDAHPVGCGVTTSVTVSASEPLRLMNSSNLFDPSTRIGYFVPGEGHNTAGVYFCRLTVGEMSSANRMLLLR